MFGLRGATQETYSPRINETRVDVVEGGTLDLVPGAFDVGTVYDEID
jgi:hypothetical protein